MSSGFPTRSDTNRAVQSQKMARGVKIGIKEVEGLYYVAKTKALISLAVSAKLICVFVFAYAKSWFSHEASHIIHMHKKFINFGQKYRLLVHW